MPAPKSYQPEKYKAIQAELDTIRQLSLEPTGKVILTYTDAMVAKRAARLIRSWLHCLQFLDDASLLNLVNTTVEQDNNVVCVRKGGLVTAEKEE